jgi:hypothetical protein
LARSSDNAIKNLSIKAIEQLNAESEFAEFVKSTKPECRDAWMFRLTTVQAQSIVGLLTKAGLPHDEIEKLDVGTDDLLRTILRPTATSDGDLYRVEAKIPADDATLKCIAEVYRSVNMQEIQGTSTTEGLAKEFAFLKSRFSNKIRVVGWYSKIFQRNLLVGIHNCKVPARAIYF